MEPWASHSPGKYEIYVDFIYVPLDHEKPDNTLSSRGYLRVAICIALFYGIG